MNTSYPPHWKMRLKILLKQAGSYNEQSFQEAIKAYKKKFADGLSIEINNNKGE